MRAAEGIHCFVWKLLRSQPPPQLRCLSAEDREDVISDLVAHWIANEFQVLRRYRDRGCPFAGFVAVSVARRATSRLRQLSGRPHEQIDESLPNDSEGDRTDCIDAQKELQRVNSCLGTLPERCQILIKAAAEGWKPRQMVVLLGWPSSANTKLAEVLRQCRKKLKRCVEAHA